MTKTKTDKLAVIDGQPTAIETIKTKEELRLEMQATLKKIEKKLANMGAGATPTWKAAGCNFKIGELDPNTMNIHASTDMSYLIKALAKMNRVKAEFFGTLEALDIPITPTCTWVGRDINDWIHDLTTRIKQVAYATKVNDLTQAKSRLETFLSEEDRLTKTLTDVSLLLK